jgi:hypothetical protein
MGSIGAFSRGRSEEKRARMGIQSGKKPLNFQLKSWHQ